MPRDVGLLEGVGADQRAADLPGDGDDRDGVHLGVGQRGDQVGGAGARRGHHDADPAGGVRVAAGGVAGALLVADQDVPQLLRVEQRVVDRQHRAAGDPEDDVDAELLQRAHHRLRAGELVGGDASRRRHARLGGGLSGGLRCGIGAVGGCGRRWLGCSRGRCAHVVLDVLVSFPSGKKKPPSASAAVRGLRAGASGYARHEGKRGTNALANTTSIPPNFIASTVASALVRRQISARSSVSGMMHRCPPVSIPDPSSATSAPRGDPDVADGALRDRVRGAGSAGAGAGVPGPGAWRCW